VVGCLVSDGADAALVTALAGAVKAAGAKMKIVAPRVGGVSGANGAAIEADFQLAGGSSVLFDAVALVVSAQGARQLADEAAAVAFVHDAFAHLKVIGHTPDAAVLLDKAGVVSDAGVISLGPAAPFVTAASTGRIWPREPKVRKTY